MTDGSGDDGGLFGRDAEDPIAQRPPKLRASVLVLAPARRRRESVVKALPEEIEGEPVEDVTAFTDALSNSVAVVLLSMGLPKEVLRRGTVRTIKDTNYARIGLLAADHERGIETRVPHDEVFYRSSDRRTFRNRIKRLYVRAYYEAALQRYYTLNVATQNRRATLDGEEATDDERLRKLRASTELMESHLRRFRQYLQPGDLDAILDRNERIEEMMTALLDGEDPTVAGLPSRCPDCGIAWDEWHGSELNSGHEKIGADTWRCTRCGTVIGGNDPDNYRVS